MIDPEIGAIITPHLADDEELLWTGRPVKRPVTLYGAMSLSMAVFGVLFFSFAAVQIPKEISNHPLGLKVAISAFVLIFALIWFWLVLWQLRQHFLAPAQEIYGFTNRRALIFSPKGNRKIRSIGPDKFAGLRVLGSEEIGDLEFPQIKYRYWNFWERTEMALDGDLSTFRNIANPLQVKTLIETTFSQES